jgi:outer membrane protein assembly factor BamB
MDMTMRRTDCLISAFVTSIALTAGLAHGDDGQTGGAPQWPGFAFDAARTGRSPYAGPKTNKLRWQFKLPDWGTGPAVGPDGTVYVGTESGVLYALGRDGKAKWSFHLPPVPPPKGLSAWQRNVWKHERRGGSVRSVAVAPDGAVLFGATIHVYKGSTTAGHTVPGHTRHLYALSPDGTVKWKLPVGEADVSTHPCFGRDGTIYVATIKGQYESGECRLHAISPAGRERWSKRLTGRGGVLSPAIGPEGTLYVGGDKLRAIDPNDGGVRWTLDVQTTTSIVASPAVAPDGTVYVAAVAGKHGELLAVSSNGSVKWDLAVGFMETSPAIAKDGTVYVTSWVGERILHDPKIKTGLTAISPDGRVKWSFETRFPEWHPVERRRGTPCGSDSSPIVGADGTIYFGTDAGLVYAVSPRGKLVWTFGAGGEFDVCPALDADGTLYVCHSGGPGEIYSGPLRCYAISDRGRHTLLLPNLTKRLNRFKDELRTARQNENEAEVRELSELIRQIERDLRHSSSVP